MCGNICSPIEVWWFPRSGRFILSCQHNWGPIFLFSEVEVGGSALFANVIPNRSYTNAIRAVFGSVVHKSDWQSESSISEMHSAILWALAFFRGERGGMPTAKVKTYPQSCGLLCWKIIFKPPGVLDLQSRLGRTKYPTFAQLPRNQLTQKKQWILGVTCTVLHTFLGTHTNTWT